MPLSICPRCEKKNEKSYAFCLGCGGDLRRAATPPDIAASALAEASSLRSQPTGAKKFVLEGGLVVQLGWSPDGDSLVALMDDGAGLRLLCWQPQTGRVVHEPTGAYCSAFAWAPDGTLSASIGGRIVKLDATTLTFQSVL